MNDRTLEDPKARKLPGLCTLRFFRQRHEHRTHPHQENKTEEEREGQTDFSRDGRDKEWKRETVE